MKYGNQINDFIYGFQKKLRYENCSFILSKLMNHRDETMYDEAYDGPDIEKIDENQIQSYKSTKIATDSQRLRELNRPDTQKAIFRVIFE